jgi:hypothetical protein
MSDPRNKKAAAKFFSKYLRKFRNQNGVALVLVAVMIVMLLGFVALAIDVGYYMVARNELQNIADGAALAACGELGAIYQSISPQYQDSYVCAGDDLAGIIAKAVDVGQNNRAGGLEGIVIRPEDVIIGRWDGDTYSFTQTFSQPDAVQVVARRDGNENNPITTFFAGLLGINTLDVSASAIAALTGPAFVEEGELETPFGLSENVFPNDCTDLIAFSPTTDSCAGWHNFFDPINANAMRNKLLGFIQGDTEVHGGGLWSGPQWLQTNFGISPNPEETPLTSAGDEFEFQGGTISSLFNGSYLDADYDGNTGTVLGNPTNRPAPIIALFDYFRYRDGDGDDSVWTATIPVYRDSTEGCINPNTALEVVGFAQIVVISPDPPPSSNIQVHIDCNLSVIEGRGGGITYGNLRGTIPNLVR